MKGPGVPSRIPVDTLRERTYLALKAAGHRGVCPAVDNVRQSVAAMTGAGISVKDQAAALGTSNNYIRVCKRNNALKLLGDAAPKTETKKEKRETAAEKKRLDKIPGMTMPIDDLHALLLLLPPPTDPIWGFDAATLRKLGFNPREDMASRPDADVS